MKFTATEKLRPRMTRYVRAVLLIPIMLLAAGWTTAFAQNAQVQIIHNAADPAARTVDIYLDGTLTLDDFNFRAATPYLDIASGSHVIAVAPSNSSSVDDAIADFNVELQADEVYTVIANGVLGSDFAENPGGAAFDISFTLYVNDMARTSGPSGKVALQVFHGSTDAPPVAVRSGGATLIDSLGYGNYSGYLEIDPAQYALDITPYNAGDVVASFNADLSGLGGSSVTVVASGFLAPGNNGSEGDLVDPFTLLAVLADGTVLDLGSARVQVIHNAADPSASTVDIYIDGALADALDDFEFRSATPFIDLSSGYHEIAVAGAQSNSVEDAIATFPVVIQPQGSFIVVANGVLAPDQFAANPDERSTAFNLWIKDAARENAQNAGQVDFFAVHGATDAPTVDIGARGVATLVDDAAYGDLTGYLSVPAASYTLDVRLGNLFTTVASFEADLSGLGGGSAAVLASGFLDPSANQDGEAFGLIAVLADGSVIELPAVTQTARAQIIHNAADPGADSVDVYINNELALDNFKFRSASPYVSLPAGEEISVAVAGPNSSSAGEALATFPATLTENETYAIIANGVLDPNNFAANPDGIETGFTLLVKAMARESAENTEKVEFYALHGATDAPTVDIAVSNGPTLVDGLSYTEITDYLAVDPSSYMLDILPDEGTVPVASFEADLSSLQGGTAAVLASGFLSPGDNQNGAAFGLIAVLADGTVIQLPAVSNTARAQIIHNAADPAADTVDVYVNGDLAIDNFAFRSATPYIDLPAEQELTIGVAGKNSSSSEDAIATFPATLDRGETYAIIANGVLDPHSFAANPDGIETGFTLLVKAMARESAENTEKVEFYAVHGATDAPTVDIAVSGGPTLVDNAAYKDITGYLDVDPASYDLDIIPDGSSEPVATFKADLSSLQGGTAAVLASGFLSPVDNQNGAAFGLIAVLADGSVLELPAVTPTARAQIIHNAADPAADIVDVYINNDLALDNFAFRSATPYIDLPAGVELTIGVAGKNSTSSEEAIATFPATLEDGETYAIIANGVLDPDSFAANPDGKETGFTLLVKAMARESAENTEKVEFYAVHGATDAPKVDIAESGGPTLVDGASYKDITGYLAVDPASYDLDIIPDGSSEPVATFEADLSSLQGGTAAVLASGFLSPGDNQNGPAFGLIAVLADGTVLELPVAAQTARAQIIHNAADPAADTVDVYVNGDLALDNFTFRSATPYIDLPAGVELTIGVAGKNSTSSEEAIATFPATLEDGETYAIIANGVLDPDSFAANPDSKDITFTLLVKPMARESANDSEKVEFFVVHGATDAPTVDVAVQNGPTLVEGAAYRDITDYLAVDPASYTLDIIPDGSSQPVASFNADLSSLAGESMAVLASGFLSPNDNQNGKAFGLIAVVSDGTVVELPVATSIDEPQVGLPKSFDLKGNYPNPFNPSTQVVFDLPQTAEVTLEVYNLLGQQMMAMNAGRLQGGSNQQIRLDASVLSSGVYIYRVVARTGNNTMMTGSGKMVLLK